MKYIKEYYESISNYKTYKEWEITYFENNHDLDKRLKERSTLKIEINFIFL
jgi:hypothetical protein